MNQAGLLYRLQRTDSQLDQIARRLKEIERLINEDQRLNTAQQSAEATFSQLGKNRNDLHASEHRVKEQRLKIEQSNAALYSGRVRNPKELEDLQKEIAALTRYLATLEDTQLQAMIDVESAEEAHASAQANLSQVEGEVVASQAGLAGEREQLLARQDSLSKERDAALHAVSKDDLTTYQHLRAIKMGIAVTSVEDGACAVCGAPIRPAEAQVARNPSALAYCSSCGRIIFAG